MSAPAGYIGLCLKDRYRILEQLGSGGFGSVYLAADEELLQKRVVVKLLHGVSTDDWTLRKFQQEKEALARIDHPGVVNVLDAGRTPQGTPFLVMQFVDGVTLRKLIGLGGMEFHRAGDIFQQIGSALQAAHEKGICHRDLKPENIMVEDQGSSVRVRLIDFGIAAVRDSAFAAGGASTKIAGTIQYMAPEQLEGKSSAETDVYAFGAIAYEVLTGKPAVGSPREVMTIGAEGLKVKPREIRSEIPETAEAVIVKAVSFKPQDRFSSAREMGDRLAQALHAAQAAVEVRRATAPKDRTGKRPWLLVGILGAAAAMGGVGVVKWTSAKHVPVTPQDAPAAHRARLEYSIRVQRSKDGKLEESDLAHEMSFVEDFRIALNLKPLQQGYLYVLNDGQLSRGVTSINVLSPSLGRSAALAPTESVRVPPKGWFAFDRQSGAEMLSLVWSSQTVPELETAKDDTASVQNGMVVIRDPERLKQIRRLLKTYRISPAQVERNDDLKHTTLFSTADILVHTIRLEHL
jgi:serine/threonine protein kinase